MFDGEAFGTEIVLAVKAHIATVVGPMQARIEKLETENDRLKTELRALAECKPERGERGEQGPPGPQGESGEDGVGIASTFIDHQRNLVLTFTDGTVGSVGEVQGRDGKDGAQGQPGRDGVNGKDGVGFDDMTEELTDNGRTLIHRYIKGETIKEFRHKTGFPRYCKIYKSDTKYDAGDQVTRGGSQWFALVDTIEPPGNGCKDWILCVKQGERGRDGKDGAPGPKGEPGKDAPIIKQKVW